jgi:RNA polymerase sigma-70 factor (ECF subfamily)
MAHMHSREVAEFGALFDRHARVIYNYCFRRTGDWATAEDLMSIVFLEAWRRRTTLRERSQDAILPWLYGVATNVVRNNRRSSRRHSAALARLPPAATETDIASATDNRLDDAYAMRDLLARLRRLPRAQQDVFVLCAWMDLTYEQVAAALNVPVGTVRSRLARARHRLRDEYASEEPSNRDRNGAGS